MPRNDEGMGEFIEKEIVLAKRVNLWYNGVCIKLNTGFIKKISLGL